MNEQFQLASNVRVRAVLRKKKKLRNHIKAYLFLLPICLSIGLFKYYPFLTAIIKSFYQWNGANVNKFIGLDNYVKLFQDPTFFISIKNIVLFTGSFIIIQLVTPLLAAVGVFHVYNKKAQNVYKTFFLVPMVVPHIIIFLLWRWIYAGDGLLNKLLESVGLDSLTGTWLGSSTSALWSIVFVGFPWISGIYFLIYLAGLVAISQELFEVGKMDGMNVWQRLRYVELPMLKGQIRLVVILAFINQFQSFENVLILTNGGPGFTTLTPALYLYKKGFEYNELGYASAIGVIVFVILVIFTIIMNNVLKPSEKID